MQRNSYSLHLLLILGVVGLSACQPTPDERFARAETYMAKAEYRSAVIELKNILQAEPDRVAARYLLAQASYVLNDMEAAESEYLKLLALNEDDADAWIGYGRSLLYQGKTAEALERAGEKLSGFGESDAAAALLGDVYRTLDNLDLASEHYRRALTINPMNESALIGVALGAVAGRDLENGIALIDSALAKLPNSVNVLRAKADVLGVMQEYGAAAELYAQAIAAESPSTPFAERFLARQNRTAALIEARLLDAAAESLEEFGRAYPGHPQKEYFDGRLAFARGDYEVAEQAILRYLTRVSDDARGQAMLGAINFSKNNLGQAEQYLSSAVRANVGGETTRLLLAETQLRLDRPNDAVQSLSVSPDEPEDAITLAMLGRAKIGVGDTESAIDYFKRSLERDGSIRSVNLALASSLVAAGQFGEAIDILTQMPPSSADAGFHRETLLMGAYLRQGNAADAEAVGKSLIQQRPNSAEAHALVGVLYVNLQQSRRARAQLNTALRIDSANPGALYALGLLAMMESKLDEAADHFGGLLDAKPAHMQALIQLASVFASSGSLGDMRPRLTAALESVPDSSGLHKLNSRIELLLGDVDAAQQSIAHGRQVFPDDSGFVYLDGIARLQAGDPGAAVSSLLQAVQAVPDNPSYQFDLARAHLANREFAEAIGVARQYRRLRPADIGGVSIEVDARIRSGDPAEAHRTVSAYAERYPEEEFALMLLGDIARASGDAAAAVDFYARYAANNWSRMAALRLAHAQQATGSDESVQTMERWLIQQPDDNYMRRSYAQLLEARGDTMQAMSQYERLAQIGDLDAIGLNNLAWYYMSTGKEGASDLAERAHALMPDNGNIADTLGWILYQEGQFERAVDILRRAAAQERENPEIRYHLAASLAKIGDVEEARSIVDELVASEADFPSRSEAVLLSRTL